MKRNLSALSAVEKIGGATLCASACDQRDRPAATARDHTRIRMLGIVDQHCVFYSDAGCALHQLGLEDGDGFMYKQWVVSTFPLDRDRNGGWCVRQHGTMDEGWDLFRLSPMEFDVPAETSLRSELEFARRMERGDEDWRDLPGHSEQTET